MLKKIKEMKGDKLLIEEKCKELGLELIDKDFDYDRNRQNVFEVKCLKCNRISTKSFDTLVKGNHGCKYCRDINRDYHNSLDEVTPKILSACEECNYTFIGFEDNEWKKCRDSKLILKCNNCGKIVHKNYDNFINKRCKCVCHRYNRLYETNVLKDDDVLSKVDKACAKHNFSFIHFVTDDGKYHNNKTILELKCNKCGEQIFYTFNHFVDRKNIVCKYCTKSSLERQLRQQLINENIEFEEQKKFEWLGKLSLDFYLPKYNIAIECQGIQHFEPVEYFGGKIAYKEQVERDKRKKKLCIENNIELRYVVDSNEINKIDEILK